MIISKLKGGLGNQLFQYAIGRKMALEQGVELKLELSFFERQNNKTQARDFGLSCFNIDASIASSEDIRMILGPHFLRPLKRRLSKMGIPLFRWNYVRENSWAYHPEILKKKAPLILDGYWQSAAYFESIRDVLLSDFELKAECVSDKLRLLQKQITTESSVALHVRRGDYVTNPIVAKEFGICSESYYEEAVSYMKALEGEPVFFVFSDDIDWCKKHFGEKAGTFVFVSGNQDYEDLMLMSACKHQIIANSSFSWWSAWLNKNPEKKVIAPKIWFADTQMYKTEHIVPQEWIRI